MTDDDVEKAMDELHEFSNKFMEAMDEIRNEREKYWNSLSKDEQLKCFCAVVERIMQGEMERHSYRGMLYTVFGFGPEAYTQAQMSGFLELHNSIFSDNELYSKLHDFAKHMGSPDPEKSVLEFYKNEM